MTKTGKMDTNEQEQERIGQTALICATVAQAEPFIPLLVDSGADIGATDGHGYSAIDGQGCLTTSPSRTF